MDGILVTLLLSQHTLQRRVVVEQSGVTVHREFIEAIGTPQRAFHRNEAIFADVDDF